MKIKKNSKSGLFCLVIILILCAGCEDLLKDLNHDDPRVRITGLWLCEESDDYLKSIEETYYVEIDAHPFDSSRVLISNFFNIYDDAEAVLSGDQLSLPLQTLNGGFTVRGSGTINNNDDQINWVYDVDDGSGVEYKITAVYKKQE
jgi:hypothetical protein